MIVFYYLILVLYSFILSDTAMSGRIVDVFYFSIPLIAFVFVIKRNSVKKPLYITFFALWFFIEAYQSFHNPLGGLLYSLIYSAIAAVVTIVLPYLIIQKPQKTT